MVEYGISRSVNQRTAKNALPTEAYAILYGQVLKPTVFAIEATFDNGEVLRNERHDGSFALLAAGAATVCELRVFGADNQILRRQDLAVLQSLAIKGKSTQCLPGSHQL